MNLEETSKLLECEHYILGEKIGSGVYRDVYVYRLDPSLVIKVARDQDGRAMNFIAERLWWQLEDFKAVSDWLAPIVSVSNMGRYLLQKRVQPMPKNKDEWPTKVPSLFTDTKVSNFGIYDNRFVCCDYGCLNLTKGMSGRLAKVEWWETATS